MAFEGEDFKCAKVEKMIPVSNLWAWVRTTDVECPPSIVNFVKLGEWRWIRGRNNLFFCKYINSDYTASV